MTKRWCILTVRLRNANKAITVVSHLANALKLFWIAKTKPKTCYTERIHYENVNIFTGNLENTQHSDRNCFAHCRVAEHTRTISVHRHDSFRDTRSTTSCLNCPTCKLHWRHSIFHRMNQTVHSWKKKCWFNDHFSIVIYFLLTIHPNRVHSHPDIRKRCTHCRKHSQCTVRYFCIPAPAHNGNRLPHIHLCIYTQTCLRSRRSCMWHPGDKCLSVRKHY